MRGYAHDLPLAHAVAGALAEPAPGHDGGISAALILGTEDIAVNGRAVPHLHGNVLLAQDAGGGLIDTLVESGAEALTHPGHGVVAGGQVDLFLIGHRLAGHPVDGLQLLAAEHFLLDYIFTLGTLCHGIQLLSLF